jgi:hypothetical protein
LNGICGTEYVSGEDIRGDVYQELRGLPGYLTAVDVELRGLNRGIEDASLRRYELYVGVNQAPDLTAAPTVTGTTLPIEYTPSGAGTYHFVMQTRNGFNLASGNTTSTTLTVDSDIEEIPVAPGVADEVTATVSGWFIRVQAYYLERDEDPPTHFRVTWTQLVSGGSQSVHESIISMAASLAAEGMGILDTEHEMDDATALPLQTGTVEVRVYARRVEEDDSITEGAAILVSVTVPGPAITVVDGMLSQTSTQGAFDE